LLKAISLIFFHFFKPTLQCLNQYYTSMKVAYLVKHGNASTAYEIKEIAEQYTLIGG